MAAEESGIEELKRLSYEIENRGKEISEDLGRARKSLDHVRKIRAVRGVIGEIKISLVTDALAQMGEFEILNEVEALKRRPSTLALRQRILDIAANLEKHLELPNIGAADLPELKKKIKILGILLELIFNID